VFIKYGPMFEWSYIKNEEVPVMAQVPFYFKRFVTEILLEF
jgi:hypothetical protein